jgi:Flp pilus assembly pilin Flp
VSTRDLQRETSDTGASSVEYGLLITGIAALIALVVFMFGDNVHDLFDDTCQSVAQEAACTTD